MKYGLSPDELADAAAFYLQHQKGIVLEEGDQLVVEFETRKRRGHAPLGPPGPPFKWRVTYQRD